MSKSNGKVLTFLRKNAIYVILSLCIVAVGISVALMISDRDGATSPSSIVVNDDVGGNEGQEGQNEGEEGGSSETKDDPASLIITFDMPVKDITGIGEYSDTMVFSSTLSRYSAHKGIDFFAVEGADVFAVYGGTVEKVENSLLSGVSVTIDHGNGLKTVYNSLSDGEFVTEGQVVNKGEKIGEVSVTNRMEYLDGAHLHFEVLENGTVIDPAKYLTIDEK